MSHADLVFYTDETLWSKIWKMAMMIIPTVVVCVYSILFVLRGASPKYYFYRPLRYLFFIHLSLGFIEYILFFITFFYTDKTLILILNIINILHAISILGMCLGVSGERYWMIPTYFWVLIIKLFYSFLLFANPMSFDIYISMFYLHGFFAWGRIFFIAMSATFLFETCAYSMSSNIGIMVSLSQALGAQNDYQYLTIFFLLVTASAILLRIIKPGFIVDNDQTNDTLYNIFDQEQIEKILVQFDNIDAGKSINDNDIEMDSKSDENNISDIKHLKKFKILVKVLFDANNDSVITIKEFANIFCTKMGYGMEITKKLWEFVDKDKRGEISLVNAAKIFADDNPHFEVDFFIDKMHKFMKGIHKKHVKKDEIVKLRADKIAREIEAFENEYKNK
eukprot:40060_1